MKSCPKDGTIFVCIKVVSVRGVSTKIKTHNMRAVSFSFMWGHTEDYCLGDSLSESSEGPLRRGKEGGQHIFDFD